MTISLLTELDEIRSSLSAPGQPFEMVDQPVNGTVLRVYKNLPPNLCHIFIQAQKYSAREFLIEDNRRITFGEALSAAAGLAQKLKSAYAIGADTRAAIAMRNSPEWVLSFLAILLAGGTAVLVNSRGAADEIVHALHSTECSLLIADERRAAAASGFQGTIITVDEGATCFRDHGRPLDLAPSALQPSNARLTDPAVIMFTSGTTGRPKGAVLTHLSVGTATFGMQHNGLAVLTRAARKANMEPAKLAAVAPPYVALMIFPLFHVSGTGALLMLALTGGGKLVFMRRWDAERALELIEREQISGLTGPPSIYWDLFASPKFSETDFSSLVTVGVGGQATPPQLIERLRQAFPKASQGGGYGQTETSGAVASGSGEEWILNPHASGRIVPGATIRIVGEKGDDLPVGCAGDILVKGAMVMAGYWNQPEANRAVFADGWLRTGDIGFLDQNRYLTIVDRKKDMIISGGENIYCAELERVFQEYPGVLEVAAFGVADERLGERAILVVVPQPDSAIDLAEMLVFGHARLAAYKIPAEVILTPDPFVRNVVGKIDKAVLRETYRDRSINARSRLV
jgi:acyl-CoA synthetase (AMP-forming)/AMP-acid ligase II